MKEELSKPDKESNTSKGSQSAKKVNKGEKEIPPQKAAASFEDQ